MPAQAVDHAFEIGGIIEQADIYEFFDQGINHVCAYVDILIRVKMAGFFDFAHHDFTKMPAAGGVAFEVIEACVMEVGLCNFFWRFFACAVFWFGFFRLAIWAGETIL